MRSRNQTTKEWCLMDDYDGKEFYKVEIAKVIDEIEDIGVLELVYKILLLEV